MTQSISPQQQVPQQQYAPIPPTNTMAVLSLVFAFLFWPLSIVFGHIGRKQIRESAERGRGLATAGLAISYAGLALFALIMLIGGLAVNSGQTSVPSASGGLTQAQRADMTRAGDEFAATYINDRPQTVPGSVKADPVATPAPEVPKGPATSFGDGTHVVGTDIVAGTYKATPSSTCYWARLSSTEDEGDVIANHFAEGPTTVTIKKGDAAFVSQRCGQWTKVR